MINTKEIIKENRVLPRLEDEFSYKYLMQLTRHSLISLIGAVIREPQLSTELSIIYAKYGNIHLEVDAESVNIAPQEIAIIKPGQRYMVVSEQHSEYLLFEVKGEVASAFFKKLPSDEMVNIPGIKVYRNVLRHGIIEEIAKMRGESLGEETYRLWISSKLYDLFCVLMMPKAIEKHEIKLVLAKAVNYMEENYTRITSIKEISGYIGISIFYFTKLFKQVYDITPHQYLIKLRLNKARGLILATDVKISEVAEVCGFGNTSHFVRSFKQHYGTTPSNYRQEYFEKNTKE